MHNDQLTHYREELVKLQSRVMAKSQRTQQRMGNEAATPDELSHVPTHPADRDTETLESDMELEANYEHMLEAIEQAFARIDEGTYGRCMDCGTDISPSRLDVLPFALRCVECESKQEQGG